MRRKIAGCARNRGADIAARSPNNDADIATASDTNSVADAESLSRAIQRDVERIAALSPWLHAYACIGVPEIGFDWRKLRSKAGGGGVVSAAA